MSFFIFSERSSSCNKLPFSCFDIKNGKFILWDNGKNKSTYWFYDKKDNKLITSEFKYIKKNFIHFYKCNNNIIKKIKHILDFYNIRYLYVLIDPYYRQTILFVIYEDMKNIKKVIICIYDNFKEDIIEIDILK